MNRYIYERRNGAFYVYDTKLGTGRHDDYVAKCYSADTAENIVSALNRDIERIEQERTDGHRQGHTADPRR